MGQKVNPNGLRTGINKQWESRWIADKKNFAANLAEDAKIRQYILKNYKDANVSKISIERSANNFIKVEILTSRVALLIGDKGETAHNIIKELKKIAGGKELSLDIFPVKNADADAKILALTVAKELEGRTSFRRAMKQAMSRAMKAGVKGIKLVVSGRLDGAEIARSESYHEGSIPLQTLRADINYATATAHTTFGAIGIKCWVYKGEILGKNPLEGGNR